VTAPYELSRTQWVPRPLEEVFPFFADAGNLEILTPPWLSFRILTPRPIAMHPGTLLDYRIRWHGIPMRWRTEITQWQPPFLFQDIQLRGPYLLWRHTHHFESSNGGTLLTDRVEYALPFGIVGRITHALSVRSAVRQIFDYRCERILERFGGPSA
jgi:ligand-binding SRPBCC domain-containing protein